MPPTAARAFEVQATACAHMGSPFTAKICQLIVQRGLPAGIVANRIIGWPASLSGDAVPLRLTGAFHRLVLDQSDRALCAVYPPHKVDDDVLYEAICAATLNHDGFINRYLNSPPQTNEVGRSALLLPAILALADRHPFPFNVFEMGASAGLNQNFSRFAYDYGKWQWGDASSPVQLTCAWRGSEPSIKSDSIKIASAKGCDIAPVDIRDEAERQRLKSYVWPDQYERQNRLSGALAIAADYPPIVEKSGAAKWLAQELTKPETEHHSLIVHTVMWQYMPVDERQKCEMLIEQFGDKASKQAPVSWLRFEADQKKPGGLLSLTHWDGSPAASRTIDLARADFHGTWIEWQSDAFDNTTIGQ